MIGLLILIAPCSVLIHECGHALTAWIHKAEYIYLHLGIGPKVWNVHTEHFQFQINLLFLVGAMALYERKEAFSKAEQAIISLAGPLANGLAAGGGLVLYQWLPLPIVAMFIAFNGWLCVMNLIPYRVGSKRSDGYITLQSIIGQQRSP
ncbi:site-2 protease family protein [Pontibacillus salicampi]